MVPIGSFRTGCLGSLVREIASFVPQFFHSQSLKESHDVQTRLGYVVRPKGISGGVGGEWARSRVRIIVTSAYPSHVTRVFQ